MANDTATEKARSAENRDNTLAHNCHSSSVPTSLTVGRAIRPIGHPIDLARHDKIVLVQSPDFVGAQRNGRVTPTEADIGVMAFGFGQVTDLSNKAKRFLKIAEVEGPFDAMTVIAQFPIRRLATETAPLLPASAAECRRDKGCISFRQAR